jgi:hypothetical protein
MISSSNHRFLVQSCCALRSQSLNYSSHGMTRWLQPSNTERDHCRVRTSVGCQLTHHPLDQIPTRYCYNFAISGTPWAQDLQVHSPPQMRVYISSNNAILSSTTLFAHNVADPKHNRLNIERSVGSAPQREKLLAVLLQPS